MPDFAQPATVRELAALVGGEVVGEEEMEVAGVASLEQAGPGDLSFLVARGHGAEFRSSRAGAFLLDQRRRDLITGDRPLILVSDPHEALQRILEARFPDPPAEWGISPDVELGTDVRWQGRVHIGPGSQIGSAARLGSDCVIGRNVSVGRAVTIGDQCVIDDNVVVNQGVRMGSRVTLKSGARVGTPGFGFVSSGRGHQRIPHPGGCLVGDDVEIGANTTVDSGSVKATVIGRGTKIDNLVQIAHNVEIGEDCIILAQAGIAGSTVVGRGVAVAGQAGLAGHLTVGEGARIAAQSGVIGDVAPGATVSGYPARNHRDVLRQAVALQRITSCLGRLEALAGIDDS